jgi:hypothetical protein
MNLLEKRRQTGEVVVLLNRNCNVLDFEIRHEAVDTTFSSKARLLETTERSRNINLMKQHKTTRSGGRPT